MSELEWMQIFGDNLSSILKEREMTQRDLADLTGLSESAISNYILKKQIPTLRAIINISYALDYSVDEMIDFGDQID